MNIFSSIKISWLFFLGSSKMAHRHIMAVCVVCLLCADHLPCKQHISSYAKINDIDANANSLHEINSDLLFDKIAFDSEYEIKQAEILDRRKRHADHSNKHQTHHHHLEVPHITRNYVERIYNYFNDNSKMSENEFKQMISHLKLNYLFDRSHRNECMSEETFLETVQSFESKDEFHQQDHHHHHEGNKDFHDDTIEITIDQFIAFCPILFYHMINRSDTSCLVFNASATDIEKETLIEMEDRKLVWFYSTLSVLIVSLCGLFGVAVIPIMEKHFYHQILQFLVALAVGTLAGDALLHLLPHSMLPLNQEQDLHRTMMFRGLATMCAIIFSYFFERFIALVMEWRQRKEKRENPTSRVRVMRDPETVSLNGNAPTCKHKYSSYPYCYNEIAMDTKDDHHEHQQIDEETILNNHRDHVILPAVEAKKVNGMVNDISNDVDNNTLTLSTSLDDGSIESNALCNNNKVIIAPVSTCAAKDPVTVERTVILREHQSKHHGHSHTHGHVHSPPESLSAVAWMVIMGDGLHNFTDGMAIGAAFSNNIAGGFSTAVAVFCHELPHELGDFAVLLKAGMSPRKAVYYNLLSSVLCFFGMCVGILLGNTPEASQWIFAIAAGLFIYIALVDMMPELTSSHGKEEDCLLPQCFLQFSGMCIGFSTMLLIGIYEHDLKEMFTS